MGIITSLERQHAEYMRDGKTGGLVLTVDREDVPDLVRELAGIVHSKGGPDTLLEDILSNSAKFLGFPLRVVDVTSPPRS